MLQQPSFALEAAAVAGQRTVGPDEAMTWNHDADRVGAIREADRTHCQRTLQAQRQAPIAQRRAHGDLAQGAPHVALKGRAAGLDVNLVDGLQLASEVTLQRTANASR